jgi:hypothetical protein
MAKTTDSDLKSTLTEDQLETCDMFMVAHDVAVKVFKTESPDADMVAFIYDRMYPSPMARQDLFE